jgi:hypothetical protein
VQGRQRVSVFTTKLNGRVLSVQTQNFSPTFPQTGNFSLIQLDDVGSIWLNHALDELASTYQG